jgi:hypothetical protein
MKLTSSLLAAAVLIGALVVPAAAQTTVPFSDPSRPGTVRISVLHGPITVKGANRRDVLIETKADPDDDKNAEPRSGRTAGLRRLSQAAGYEAVEENNQVIITSSANDDQELVVHVPSRTNLKVNGTNGDFITVDGVDGDIETQHVNGDITLTNVAGTVIAHTTNGDVKATLTRVTADRPMAFTSFNGDIDVTLPASTKATFKLRSDMGDVYTDFDLKVSTQTATSQGTRTGGRYRIEVNKALTGTLNGGGPEIELRTFNGDVYLRRAGQ